jgi:serine phosphatase RsbU (regulator of sigma subunit)
VAARPIAVAAASRTYPGESENGDAWAVHWHEGRCRIAVIDGLGHGPLAAAAARLALAALDALPELAPAEALTVCHRALVGSRGAVITVVQIDSPAHRLTHAGIGNIDGYLCGATRVTHLVSDRGIVGGATRQIRAYGTDLDAGWLLLLHTDGVSARFNLREQCVLYSSDPQVLANAILANWGRTTDDATVVVACPIVLPNA